MEKLIRSVLLAVILAACGGAPVATPEPTPDYDLIPLDDLTCDDWRLGMSQRQRDDAAQIMLSIIWTNEGITTEDPLPQRDSAEWFADQIVSACRDDGETSPSRHGQRIWDELRESS